MLSQVRKLIRSHGHALPNAQIFHDSDAEQIILAHCLYLESAEPLADLSDLDFFSGNNQIIARCIRALAAEGKPINYLEVYKSTQSNGHPVDASYISGLTDSIGMVGLKAETLTHYRGRIQEARRVRETRKEAAALAHAVETGESTEAIAARAAQLAERTGKPKAQTREEEAKPKLPENAWHPLALDYRNVIAPTTCAADSHHLGAFLAGVGAMLGHSIYTLISEPLWPNVFCVLIGPPGEGRKSSTMIKAMRMVHDVTSSLEVLRSMDSAESFKKQVAAFQGRDVDAEKRVPIVVQLSELRAFVDKANRKGLENMVPTLCMAYDGEALVGGASASSCNTPEPQVSVIAGSSKEYIKKFQKHDLEGGLGSRLAWIWGDPKPYVFRPPPINSDQYKNLIIDLKQIITYWRDKGRTEMKFSKAADDMAAGFTEEELPKLRPEDPMLRKITVRYDQYLTKIAMQHAALDMKQEIEPAHIYAGIQFVRFILAGLRYVFDDYGIPRWVEEERAIVDKVKSTMPRGISRRNLQRLFWRIGAEGFNRHMKALTDFEGPLVQKTIGSQKLWIYYQE